MVYTFNDFLGGLVLFSIMTLLVWCLGIGFYCIVCLLREYLAKSKEENFLEYLEKTQKHKLSKGNTK